MIIDVSEHNGKIDWSLVKPNIEGAIIRVGLGNDQTDQDDVRAVYNMDECQRLGITWGAYLYSYAKNTSMLKSEYAHMKRMLKGRNPMLPWYLDLEEKDCASFARQAAQEWYNLCKADGVAPGVYASTCYFLDHIKSVPGDTSLWIADYRGAKPNIGRAYDGWQYTSSGKVNGIPGAVDLSVWYKSLGGKWQQEWHYYNADGSMKKNEWLKYKNDWYYLKPDGRMAHDEWVNDGKGWAYLDKDGKALHDQWLKYKNDWYYLKSNCYMAVNECIPYKDKKCCVDKNGKWDGKYV